MSIVSYTFPKEQIEPHVEHFLNAYPEIKSIHQEIEKNPYDREYYHAREEEILARAKAAINRGDKKEAAVYLSYHNIFSLVFLNQNSKKIKLAILLSNEAVNFFCMAVSYVCLGILAGSSEDGRSLINVKGYGEFDFYSLALKAYKKIEHFGGMAAAHFNLGYYELFSGLNYKPALAKENFDKSLELYGQEQNKYWMARIYAYQVAFLLEKNREKKIKMLEKAISLNIEIKNMAAVGGNYRHLAKIYSEEGNYQKAESYFIKAFLANPNLEGLGDEFFKAGRAYLQKGDLEKAEKYFKAAMKNILIKGEWGFLEEELKKMLGINGHLLFIHKKNRDAIKQIKTIYRSQDLKNTLEKEMCMID